MNKIPICIITDKNLSFAAATLIVNLLEKASENTFYEIYCFINKSVPNEDREKISSIQNNYPKKCLINMVDMGEKYLSENCTHDLVTNACWYKFSIIEKILNFDKILYLDLDILVRDDLSDLYAIEMDDNYLAGCIRYGKSPKALDLIRKRGFSTGKYINAGIMLMNLKKMREDNLLEKLESLMPYFPDTIDQDIFNIVCAGKILSIDIKYNYIYDYRYFDNLYKIRLNNKELRKLISSKKKHPTILHYVGSAKPWLYSNMWGEKQWYKYYKKTPYGLVKLKRKLYFLEIINLIRHKIKRIINKHLTFIHKNKY